MELKLHQCVDQVSVNEIFFPTKIQRLTFFFLHFLFTSTTSSEITQEDCVSKGYNLTCIQKLTESVRASSPPALKYGETSPFGINPNCGGDIPATKRASTSGGGGRPGGTSGSEVCYEGLEKAKFYSIPMTSTPDAVGLGQFVTERNADVVDWYDGFRYTMTSSTCEEQFANYFDYDIACAEDKTPGMVCFASFVLMFLSNNLILL